MCILAAILIFFQLCVIFFGSYLIKTMISIFVPNNRTNWLSHCVFGVKMLFSINFQSVLDTLATILFQVKNQGGPRLF